MSEDSAQTHRPVLEVILNEVGQAFKLQNMKIPHTSQLKKLRGTSF